MALKTRLGELLLEAYKEALTTRKPNDFTVVGVASTIIRLEGREGRMAVQATQRSIRPNSAALTSARQSQGTEPKKSVRLTFPKQEEGTEEAATETATKFGLKRIGATQDNDPNKSLPDNHGQSQQSQSGNKGDAAVDIEELMAELDYYKAIAKAEAIARAKAEAGNKPDEPSEEDKDAFEKLKEVNSRSMPAQIVIEEDKDQTPIEKPKFVFQEKAEPEPKPKDPLPLKADEQPLSEAEQELVKTMKPGGVGREFGLERLRATLTDLGIEWKEEHSATVLAGALLKTLNPK